MSDFYTGEKSLPYREVVGHHDKSLEAIKKPIR